MKGTLFTTGPHVNMIFDGMIVSAEEDGKIVWTNPAGTCFISVVKFDILTLT